MSLTLPKIKPPHLSGILIVLVLIAGCTPTPGTPFVSSPTALSLPVGETQFNTATPLPATSTFVPTLTPTVTAAPAAPTPLTQYQLDVKLDYALHFVSVHEQISVTNRWKDPLSSLVLVVSANDYSGVFDLKSVTLNADTPLAADAYTLTGNRLEIPLAIPLSSGSKVNLTLEYDLALPAIPEANPALRPDPFGYSERQTNLVNWYPYLAAYQSGEGWLVHKLWVFGEHEVYDAADYSVNLELVNSPADLVIAASAQSENQTGQLHYSLPKARTFAISASSSYLVESQVVGNTTVYAYSFPWDKAAGDAALRDTAKSLELYNRLFGPYERPSLSVVEAGFLDGMEYDGLYFLSYGFYNLYDGTPAGYLTAIAVHETAHQWWYGKIGSDQALEPWLDEAMATYCEHLFYEQIYPENLGWWQSVRVNLYDPQGYINRPVSAYPTYDQYRNAVYLNGALFFEDLRQLVGDDAFFAFLKDYATQFAYQRATTRDFFDVLKQHTSVDLTPLLQKYFDPALYP